MSAAPASVTTPRSVSRTEWVALWLLVISVGINYIDRGNLSVAGVALIRELHLSKTELGWLLSAFFWTYACMQMVSGWLIDRFNVVWVFALGFLLWSGATAATGLVSGFATLFALRLLLGISESVAYPSYSKIIAAGFPERQRGMANGLIDAGSKIGPALGMLAGGLILSHFGWRWLFLGIGCISLLWLIPWLGIARQIRTPGVRECRYAPSLGEIFSKRDAWGTFLGLFCANYGWYFMLTWIPQYLIIERHYSTEMMAKVGSLPFWTVAAGSVFGGWLSDRWIDAGASATRVRKTFVVGGLAIAAVLFLPAAMIVNQVHAMIVLSAASFAFGLFSSNHWALTQTLAGPLGAGKWTGIQNMMGNFAGVAAPVITGTIVDRTGSFYFAFVWVCCMVLVGAGSYLFITRRIEPVQWRAAVREDA